MSCPKRTRGAHRRRVNYLLAHPVLAYRVRHWKPLRHHLDYHRYLTPNFAYAEMADSETHRLVSRDRSIVHAWNLERFARELGKRRKHGHGKRVAITIDGPSRTKAHNAQVHGAADSRHMHGDASDHFKVQVERWQKETGLSLHEVIAIADRYFTAIGNENSGTLHFDSRPGRAGSVHFTTWVGV